jgi:hypothetical protein
VGLGILYASPTSIFARGEPLGRMQAVTLTDTAI